MSLNGLSQKEEPETTHPVKFPDTHRPGESIESIYIQPLPNFQQYQPPKHLTSSSTSNDAMLQSKQLLTSFSSLVCDEQHKYESSNCARDDLVRIVHSTKQSQCSQPDAPQTYTHSSQGTC